MAGIVEEWQLIETIQTSRGSGHHLSGSVGGQTVALNDIRTGHIFASNLANKELIRVISTTRDAARLNELIIYRCVSLGRLGSEGHLVACGTRNGQIIIIKNFRQCE